ncbi:MAG: hypothetical protein KIT44_06650 [Opitutaceae bacterium]|nr:hypothetical protein [Opitutaceae bacterium]
MFKRLILEDYAALFTVGAFIVAVTIYLTMLWRAVRMPRGQTERFARLPFESESSRHDERA